MRRDVQEADRELTIVTDKSFRAAHGGDDLQLLDVGFETKSNRQR